MFIKSKLNKLCYNQYLSFNLNLSSNINMDFNFYKFKKNNIVDFDPNKDYYKVLGISQTNDEKQIKNAYYDLAKKFHPDTNHNNSNIGDNTNINDINGR